jgi:hypothetical protein
MDGIILSKMVFEVADSVLGKKVKNTVMNISKNASSW